MGVRAIIGAVTGRLIADGVGGEYAIGDDDEDDNSGSNGFVDRTRRLTDVEDGAASVGGAAGTGSTTDGRIECERSALGPVAAVENKDEVGEMEGNGEATEREDRDATG